MTKFITIGYGDRQGYERTANPIRDAAHAHDERLKEGGALIGVAGVPVQVRNHEAKAVRTENGPYMSAQLPIAEALSMAEAIKMVSQTPCAVAYGVVEIWPLEQPGGAYQ